MSGEIASAASIMGPGPYRAAIDGVASVLAAAPRAPIPGTTPKVVALIAMGRSRYSAHRV